MAVAKRLSSRMPDDGNLSQEDIILCSGCSGEQLRKIRLAIYCIVEMLRPKKFEPNRKAGI